MVSVKDHQGLPAHIRDPLEFTLPVFRKSYSGCFMDIGNAPYFPFEWITANSFLRRSRPR